MLATFWELAVQTLRKLYVRVILIAALSLVAVALAKVLGAAIPEGLAERIGAGAVDPILATLATSMLAVSISRRLICGGAERFWWETTSARRPGATWHRIAW